MPEKTPGKSRKSTSSRKKEAEQKSQKSSTVTPIDQAGTGQSRTKESSPLAGSKESSTVVGSSQVGAHPSADQSGAAESPNPITKHIGSTPNVLNPSGSVQEGNRAAGVRQGGQELHERIRARAYELFELRGRREGYDQEDWAQAEAEVLAEFDREKSA